MWPFEVLSSTKAVVDNTRFVEVESFLLSNSTDYNKLSC